MSSKKTIKKLEKIANSNWYEGADVAKQALKIIEKQQEIITTYKTALGNIIDATDNSLDSCEDYEQGCNQAYHQANDALIIGKKLEEKIQ